MHFLSSNFNLLSKNTLWNDLTKNKFEIDKKYNNFFYSLNDYYILDRYNTFHLLIFVNENNIREFFQSIKAININKLKKSNKFIYFYIYYETNQNNIINKNLEIKIFEILKILNVKNIKLETIAINKLNKFLNDRNRIFLKFPFDINYIKKINNKILSNIKVFNSKPYKLIILDCDNTLWGGVLDEEKIQGINYSGDGIGQIYYEFQKKLSELKKLGFILSLSSKNTESKVWLAMKERKMILQKKDFINPKINWSDKAENISLLINELTLRPSDCVFIDDNIIEIKKVKNKISSINTIHLNDPINILKQIEKDLRFQKNNILKEDLKKYNQYKIKAKYENLSKKKTHSIYFFKSLKQKIQVHKLNNTNIERAKQLFNKTNQFNFNLNRYSISELNYIKKSKEHEIFLFSFKDKFGDHGLIGAYIIKYNKHYLDVIDFVISCRVLNRYVEENMLLHILKRKKFKKFTIYYNQTNLNKELIPEFLKKKFFKLIEKKGKRYKYNFTLTSQLNDVKKIFT